MILLCSLLFVLLVYRGAEEAEGMVEAQGEALRRQKEW